MLSYVTIAINPRAISDCHVNIIYPTSYRQKSPINLLKYRGNSLVGFAALLLLPLITQAQTLLVNFGNETIANWNRMGSINSDLLAGSVIDSTGATLAGVAITTNNFLSGLSNSGTYAAEGTAPAWMSSSAATTTWSRSGSSASATVVFSGLNDSLTYTLDLVSARNTTSTTTLSKFTVNSGSIVTNFNSATAWRSGESLTWTAITPVSGTITLEVIGINTSNTGYLNAIRLTSSIPEPSTYAVILGGVVMIAALHRSRRRS
jgi:hypothetical protein